MKIADQETLKGVMWRAGDYILNMYVVKGDLIPRLSITRCKGRAKK